MQGNTIICGVQRESSLEDSRETLRGLVLTPAGFAPRLELEIDLLSIQGLAEGSFSMISLAAESLSFNFFNSSPRFRATETLEVARLFLQALLSSFLRGRSCWSGHE